ncbi:unnamed protein product [Macrosiphum euphorbiae]|nr:unnamed protein product [Macrosiphum euphorbiae]
MESGILSSSSSSDSSDDEELYSVTCNGIHHVKPKVKDFVVNVVHSFTDDEFLRNFRLSRTTVDIIVTDFMSSDYYPKYTAGKPTISAEAHILMFLWFAGNKTVMRIVAQVFNCSESSFFVVFNRVVEFLLNILPSIIKMPTSNDDKIQCAYEFQQIAGIPDVLGAIDGSYISIRKPKHKIRSTYFNRHHDCSLTLQGICNAKKKFVDVFTETPGDAAYPLEENIITPFKDYGNLTNNEKLFNKNHAKKRVIIENTFGLLKGRFRQLLKLDFSLAEKDSNFILACCVLHNLCTDDDDLVPEQPPVELEELPENVTLNIHPGTLQSREKGFQKRKMLCTW